MTEEKKANRRKVLAKWLKENILRLGPTFIKIGQQFSTRVDILPQEYVEQLSELQVHFISIIMISAFHCFSPLFSFSRSS
jgi:predicted unusual protein kinase regulating ubiquinone biosynthesis (AarF/ABC1/UbiB family)